MMCALLYSTLHPPPPRPHGLLEIEFDLSLVIAKLFIAEDNSCVPNSVDSLFGADAQTCTDHMKQPSREYGFGIRFLSLDMHSFIRLFLLLVRITAKLHFDISSKCVLYLLELDLYSVSYHVRTVVRS